MKRAWLILAASLVAGVASAQQATLLYLANQDLKDQGISLSGWGSGVVSDTDEVSFVGSHSIRISTKNFYQGGMVNWAKPIDVSGPYADKANLLELTVKVADSGVMGGMGGKGGGAPGGGVGGGKGGFGFPGGGGAPGAPGGGRGGFGAGGQNGRPGGGQGPGGFPGGGPGGFPGGGPGGFPGRGGAGSASETKLKNIRMIVTTSDALRSEVYIPVNLNAATDNGWIKLSAPLQAISGFDRTNKKISSLAFSGDAVTTFYLGDLRIVSDTTPITGDVSPKDLNLGIGEEVTLHAVGDGGASLLKYTWDFGTGDGLHVDAEGQTVKRKFRKSGTYIITLTISDYYGLKAPYTTTVKAVVNP